MYQYTRSTLCMIKKTSMTFNILRLWKDTGKQPRKQKLDLKVKKNVQFVYKKETREELLKVIISCY